MKQLLTILVCLVIQSCTKLKDSSPNDLELICYNKKIFSYSKNSSRDTINVIRYSLKNNSNELYLINNIIKLPELRMIMLKKNGINMSIYDKNDIEVKYFQPIIGEFDNKSIDNTLMYLEGINAEEKRLGYKHSIEYFKNTQREELFFIHPKEILFFECSFNINKPIKHNGNRLFYANLDSKTDYYAKLKIVSDSSNYKNDLPRDILETIKVNNAKVYHGIVEAKNKVLVKVLE
ncbi:hypothetical protein Flavo103_12230 [Flavobacterium collinsii]|uniref:hypothetical protein n=1 Tax=Flavobacterium collinsii TaxID=1114861 RepID=UPI0022C8470A|nr:hypothetical protein [Flavobacterium collinsii]GIQ58087.1 hypothetical protein Flavo103_12230 [Flavobacterium collinsii]